MRIMVLNDGETYTVAHGCLMLEVPEETSDAEIKRLAFMAYTHPSQETVVASRGVGGAYPDVEATVLGRF